jgi:hypothetical protein
MNTARQRRNPIVLVVVLVIVPRRSVEDEDQDEQFARPAEIFTDRDSGRANIDAQVTSGTHPQK